MTQQTFRFGIDRLSVKMVIQLANRSVKGVLTPEAIEKVNRSSERVRRIVEEGEVVYGINTGFGPLCTTVISSDQTTQLQENILMSHAVGVGHPIDDMLVRIMLVTKIQALAQGFSGIQLTTLERLIWHLEEDILPVVPEQGSVGASGDLAPLSHLFLPLIGLGRVRINGQIFPTDEYFAANQIYPVQLSPKEGLALINGTQFILAHATLLTHKIQQLLDQEDLIGAMMIEGLMGSVKPFDARLHEVRPYHGSRHVAARIRTLLDQSEIVHSHVTCARVQDPYSLRCMPQVHGASRQAWLHLKESVETELNAVTDNPLIFEDGSAISGGNFHGQLLALPIDYAALAVSEIGNIADRRVYLSLEGDTPGVPKLLLKETGTNSGFMILQYTTAALASENKGLCFPASADSIPTSLGQEDHVSMGSISGRKALRILENVEKIQAIELICAAQAVEYHNPLKSGAIIEGIHDYVRSQIPFVTKDQVFTGLIETALEMVQSGALNSLANQLAADNSINLATEWSEKFD